MLALPTPCPLPQAAWHKWCRPEGPHFIPRLVTCSPKRCGCVSIPAHAGNVATEDVVYMLTGLGVRHGVDMEALLDASDFICTALGRRNASHVAQALLAARRQRAEAGAAA